MLKLPLPTHWQLRAVGTAELVPPELQNRDIPAQVPGCVHLDLMRENLIPDPYLDLNEALVQWIGFTDWEYSTQFDVTEEAMREERVDLVCEGLDTIATVWVNDVEVGKSENMHVERRWGVKAQLRVGSNAIRIRFDSAVYWARANMAKLGELPHASSFSGSEPFHFIRKNACNFGWDWGPGLTTAGVWKPIRLEAWSVARIKSVRPLVKVANEKVAVVDVEVDLEMAEQSEENGSRIEPRMLAKLGMDEELMVEGYLRPNGDIWYVTLFLAEPQVWWPHGYGAAPLYDLVISMSILDLDSGSWTGAKDRFECKIGLREVELDTSPDEIGAA